MRELDGVWCGDLLPEVLERGGLHLVITEVVPVSGGADKKLFKKFKKEEENLRMSKMASLPR